MKRSNAAVLPVAGLVLGGVAAAAWHYGPMSPPEAEPGVDYAYAETVEAPSPDLRPTPPVPDAARPHPAEPEAAAPMQAGMQAGADGAYDHEAER